MEAREDELDNHSLSSMDERKGCRSLLCDANGIIIAEMVYRCMVCYSIHDFIGDVSKHYHAAHMNVDDNEHEDGLKEEDDEDIDQNCNNNNYLNDYSNNCDHQSLWDIDNKYSFNEKLKPTTHSIPHQKISNASSESCTKSGYIHCPVCSTIRCYTTLQRRYGQFTCVACYRFFKEFFMKPMRFSCPYLGQCPLDVKSKCKACWIYACIKVYTVDGRRKSILEANTPIKSSLPPATSTKLNESIKTSINSGNSMNDDNNNNCSDENYEPKSSHKLGSSPNNGLPSDFNNFVSPISTIDRNGASSPASDLVPPPHAISSENCSSTTSACDSSSMGGVECDMSEENSYFKDEAEKFNGYDSSGTSSVIKEPVSNGKSGKKVDRRSKARVKNWCCLKCVNCLADDCGVCINCLDRPKFGGKFIRKQRCIKKKCLEKIQSEA